LVPGSRKAPPIGFRSVVGLRQQGKALIELFKLISVLGKWPKNRLLGHMTKDEILARKTGCGGNAGLMESKENIKPFPTLPTVLGNHQRTVITTFPPHGDYYWIWTLLLCSRQDISALQQQAPS
jgi:hypothetical protein